MKNRLFKTFTLIMVAVPLLTVDAMVARAEEIRTGAEEKIEMTDDALVEATVARHYELQNNGDVWTGTSYTLADGTLVKNAFFCDGTYTYFLQNDGTPMTDRLTYHPDGEHVIYFDAAGHEVFSNFANVKKAIAGNPVDDLCFFDVRGYMYTDVVTYDQSGTYLYYANQYGVMERGGWFTFSDKQGGGLGYGNADGTLMVNQYTYDMNGNYIYIQGNGRVLGTSGVATLNNEEACPVGKGTQEASKEEKYEDRVIELVNIERVSRGIEPLVKDYALTNAATARAQEITVKFSHTRPDGRSCFSILEDQGCDNY